MKTLLLDIETTANLIWAWGIYEQDALHIEKEWYILCVSYKWLDKKSVTTIFSGEDDALLLEKLWEVMDKADIIIAHNGDRFDFRKINARFIQLGHPPPSPYMTIDTLKVARKYFKFNSNRLNDIGEYLGEGKKVETGGFKLWFNCIKGDKKAIQKMKKYNRQDVLLLEKVYLRLRSWIVKHPHDNYGYQCSHCASYSIQLRGYMKTKVSKFRKYWCKMCGGWSTARISEKEKPILV